MRMLSGGCARVRVAVRPWHSQQMRGKGSWSGRFDDAIRAERRVRDDQSRMLARHCPDARRPPPERVPGQRRESCGRICFRDEGDELPLVRDEPWVEAEELTRSAHRVLHRDGDLVDVDPDASPRRDLDERRRKATARRIAHGVHVRTLLEQCLHEAVQRSSVAPEIAAELDALATREHGNTMIPDRAREQHGVAGLDAERAELDAVRDDADTRRVDEDTVGAATVDDLRVARDDRHLRTVRSGLHGVDETAQIRDREALLQDEREGERERTRSADSKVVDRAVHGELSDVASRKEDRGDDVRVRGECQAHAAADVEDRLVIERREGRVLERRQDEPLDELR